MEGTISLCLTSSFTTTSPSRYPHQRFIYHFLARKPSLSLVLDMPDSNKNWKNRYFFIQGTEWVCRPEVWTSIPDGFDNTWGIIKEFGESLAFYP